MPQLEILESLVNKFAQDYSRYKQDDYNEASCRQEFLNPLLECFGWDVSNRQNLRFNKREVLVEQNAENNKRPDYSLTRFGIVKFFFEAKKPHVDISTDPKPAIQARKYGWNAKHPLVVLSNFEQLLIYDCSEMPTEADSASHSLFRSFNYREYVEKYDEISELISKAAVYSDNYDSYIKGHFPSSDGIRKTVDELFLEQINKWRIALGQSLYEKKGPYLNIEHLNDVVQEFINKIIFLRICEDRRMPYYENSLQMAVEDPDTMVSELDTLFKRADRRYNSGLFSSEEIVFDLSNNAILSFIKELYYPASPYLFNIIEPHLLGKVYEQFLTQKLDVDSSGQIYLTCKIEYIDRAIVTTPTKLAKSMVELSLSNLVEGKSPSDIHSLRVADIACGSGVFLVEVFDYLVNYLTDWYVEHSTLDKVESRSDSTYKLVFSEKKQLMTDCLFGVDVDYHAVEAARLSLLIKLVEGEDEDSVESELPVLPDLEGNIKHGNSLVPLERASSFNEDEIQAIVPFSWSTINRGERFDLIIGNPPYVETREMRKILNEKEVDYYINAYGTAYRQFDKYFLFIEKALKLIKRDGIVSFVVPNKFFTNASGEQLRNLIAYRSGILRIDDFGSSQLFEDKTIYSSVIILRKNTNESFFYQMHNSIDSLTKATRTSGTALPVSILKKRFWMLTEDLSLLSLIQNIETLTVPLENYVECFNGIQTSAESKGCLGRPSYWFDRDEVISESPTSYIIHRGEKDYSIEKGIVKPYFKPVEDDEYGLTSYDIPTTTKLIIFPYDEKGKLIPKSIMETQFSGTWQYLNDVYDDLRPRTLGGKRDVKKADSSNWYQYGRSQQLTGLNDRVKLIAGVLRKKNPMYAYDDTNMLIASGGTAGYIGISVRNGSPYSIEFIQAWLSHHYTLEIISISGSHFEGDYISAGTHILKRLPIVKLDFSNPAQKEIHDSITRNGKQIRRINEVLADPSLANSKRSALSQRKEALIQENNSIIDRIYRRELT